MSTLLIIWSPYLNYYYYSRKKKATRSPLQELCVKPWQKNDKKQNTIKVHTKKQKKTKKQYNTKGDVLLVLWYYYQWYYFFQKSIYSVCIYWYLIPITGQEPIFRLSYWHPPPIKHNPIRPKHFVAVESLQTSATSRKPYRNLSPFKICE